MLIKTKHAFYLFLVMLIIIFTSLTSAVSSAPKQVLIKNIHSIEGYTSKISYSPGEIIELKVHAPRGKFDVDFIRYGKDEELLLTKKNIPGTKQDYQKDAYKSGANWKTTYKFPIPKDWKSGIYFAKLKDNTQDFYIAFVVKSKTPSKIALLASTNTWQAYNYWGGASLYKYEIKDGSGKKLSEIVNFNRPNIRTGAPIGQGHLIEGERFIISWLEQQGRDYAMIAESDLHNNPSILNQYKVLIINTHSEYWTQSMYDGLKNYLKQGGNVLYLSGNGVYWKTVIKGSQMEVRKDNKNHTLSKEKGGQWRTLGQPESAVLGVAYTKPGYNTYAPYQVKNASHWIFEGTGVKDSDLIGLEGLNGGAASGYETDKVNDSSPKNLVLLAKGTNPDNGGADMTYYDHPGGGGVFSVGSISFGGSLVVDDKLTKIVNNVLNRFLNKEGST